MRISTICKEIKKEDNHYSVLTDGVEIRIWFLTDDILRLRAGFDGNFREESYSLTLTAWPDRMDSLMKDYRKRIEVAPSSIVEDGNDVAVIQGRKLKVIIEKKAFRIVVLDNDGTQVHADIVDLAWQEDGNHRRIHTSEIANGDHYYGFGEKSGHLDKIEKFMTMSPSDAMGYNPEETDSLYKHIPFFIRLNENTRKAVGYFYHNTAECDFNIGRRKSNYWKRHAIYRTDSGDVDLFIINGPEVRSVIERYTDLTGKSAMLPRYALGYMGSSMYYPELEKDCDDAIIGFIDTTKEEGIPVDGFQLSSGYTSQNTKDGVKRCVFTWNKERFKDPKKFFSEMARRGIGVSPNVKPGILLVHPDLEEMKKEHIFVRSSVSDEPAIGTWWGGKGVFADFTDPHAREYWKKILKKNVIECGTSSVWNDNCEYDSLVDKDSRVCFEGEGNTIGAVKSVMSNIMCHITKEAIEDVYKGSERPFIVCRSGHAGIQRYAQTWAGDNLTCWQALKFNIATILGMSLSGVANQGCDIGGFYGPSPEKELFVRWIQNGIFQPRFSIHSVNTDNTVTEPWMYGDVKDIIRRAIEFRYELAPYLYSLMVRAHETGLPIMEPFCSAFQDSPETYNEDVSFMEGDSLLVANVVEKGARTRSIHFPAGHVFYDYYTRERYEGGKKYEIPVDLSSIPLFVTDNAIIPLSEDKNHNLRTEETRKLRVLIGADRDNSFTLVEDDGITEDYLEGKQLRTLIKVESGVHTKISFDVSGNYESALEDIVLDVIHREKAPFHVALDGKELEHFLHRAKFEASDSGWYYSQNLKSVLVKFPYPKKSFVCTISFEQFDMIGM